MRKASKKNKEMMMNPIKQLRVARKISMRDLADQIDTTSQAIYHWEHGSKPTYDKLLAIAKVFSCDVEELSEDLIRWNELRKED